MECKFELNVSHTCIPKEGNDELKTTANVSSSLPNVSYVMLKG